MSNVTVTLNDFVDISGAVSQWSTAVESSKTITSLKEIVSGRAPDVTWPVAFEEIVNKIHDMLDVSLPDVAAAAWSKYKVLQKYADSEKYPPNETVVVPLATHTIRSVSKPYVEILVSDEPVGKVNFEVDLELTLEGVVLSIQSGRIVQIRIGACHGTGSLSCEGIPIARKDTKSFSLPGAIRLKPGIPIASAKPGDRTADAQRPGSIGT